MDTYFKLKIFSEYILPFLIVAIGIAIIFFKAVIDTYKESRIEKFFISHGYERKLFDVSSFGNGAFYGWVRESDGKRVDDRQIRGKSFKEIKAKYK